MTHDAIDAALIERLARGICRAAGHDPDYDKGTGFPKWKHVATEFRLSVALDIARHGLAIVPAEGAGAARDMREAAARALNRLDAGGDCEHNRGTEPDTGAGLCSLENRSGYCICGEVNDALSKARDLIRALPLPASPPDGREAMRSADEIRKEIERLKAGVTNALRRGFGDIVSAPARIAALEWVLSPPKPQGPGK